MHEKNKFTIADALLDPEVVSVSAMPWFIKYIN